jgi:hypothetical protein
MLRTPVKMTETDIDERGIRWLDGTDHPMASQYDK